MSGQIIKSGYIEKYSKGTFAEKWKRVWVTIYKDSGMFFFKKKGDPTSKFNIRLQAVRKYLRVGSYCREIPYSPDIPSNRKLEHMIAFPDEPKKKAKWSFLLCEDDEDFNSWMSAINSVLPQDPNSSQHQGATATAPPPTAPPPAGAGAAFPTPAYNAAPAYGSAPPAGAPGAPIVPVQAQHVQAGPPQASGGGGIGFETLAGAPGGAPPPYTPYPQPPAPGGYPPPGQPQYQPPSQGYPPAPRPQQQYPQYPPPAQQPYPQQPYAQQPYPQQPAAYPQQQYRPAYPQQPGQPQGYYQQQQQPGYYQHQQQPRAQQGQTIIIKEKKNKGVGKMTAGLIGGAVAGYAAGRMMGGPCHGYGYGYHGYGPGFGWGWGGSWSSGSWGSWSSIGSFGSFGSWD